LSAWQDRDLRRKFSVPRIGINGHERALDQVEKLAGLATRTHNNRFCDHPERLRGLIRSTRHGQIAVSRVKIGNLAAERAGKAVDRHGKETTEEQERDSMNGTQFHESIARFS